MSETSNYTYRFNWILIGVICTEVLFWGLFAILLYTFGFGGWNDETSEQLLFKHESLLFLLAGPVVLSVAFLLLVQWKIKALDDFTDEALRKWVITPISSLNTFLKYFFLRMGAGILIIALATPLYGERKVNTTSESMEVIIGIDLSRSMDALDMVGGKSRLKIAKMAAKQLVNNLHGDKVGIVIFAGSAFTQLPLTSDYAAAKIYIDELNTEMISNQGTDIGIATDEAVKAFSSAPTSKTILFITDCEDQEGNAMSAVQKAKAKGMTVSFIGLGSTRGVPIPKLVHGQSIGYHKDAQGNVVSSRVNGELIQQLANAGGGAFEIAEDRLPNLVEMLTYLQQQDREEIDSDELNVKNSQTHSLLIFSLVLIVLGLFWSNQKLGLIERIIRS